MALNGIIARISQPKQHRPLLTTATDNLQPAA
jgi:hypothetical protein